MPIEAISDMEFIYTYLSSQPKENLITFLYAWSITMIFGLGSLFFFLGYSYWGERAVEKQEALEEHTILYGIKETAVTIRRLELNKNDEEFLRHVRAFSGYTDLQEVLENFIAFLKLHNHENYEDMRIVYYILKKYELESAYKWLSVAQAFWILHPWEIMLSYVPFEFQFDYADEVEHTEDNQYVLETEEMAKENEEVEKTADKKAPVSPTEE